MIADDSAVYRQAVARALSEVPGVEVVGHANHGGVALKKLDMIETDLLILDMNMPDMDGLATLRALQEKNFSVRVLLLSGHTKRGAENTIRALCLGAEDFIPKPNSKEDPDVENRLRELLVKRILAAPKKNAAAEKAQIPPSARLLSPRQVSVVAIGASTGGPAVLTQMFEQLAYADGTIFIAQHMPALFTSSLAEQLDKHSKFRVVEAQNGERVRPGVAYLAPGGRHLEVERDERDVVRIRIQDSAPVNHCRPSVDVLFTSVAQAYGSDSMGLVLTGMGQDGTGGATELVSAGAEVYTQDRESSVVWGMPRALVERGLANQVPLEQLPQLIDRALSKAGA